MQLSPHLTFDGNCREAFEFYSKVIGGHIATIVDLGGVSHRRPRRGERTAQNHARDTEDGGETLAGSDAVKGGFTPIQGVHMILEPPDITGAERIFAALSEGGLITMPLAETFWAHRYGMLTDRFGVPWEINCGKPR